MRTPLRRRGIFPLILSTCLLLSGAAAAGTVDIGNQTCSFTHGLYDYYSNGEYIGSAWELENMTCFDNPGTSYSGEPGVGGGGGGAVPACRSGDPAVAAEYQRSAASKMGRDINDKPDNDRNEYLGVIHRDSNGALRMSNLIQGGAGVSASPSAFGTSWGRIVGIVHNHPRERYCPDPVSCQINRNPSSELTVPAGQQSDWETAEIAVANGADPDLLTLYVVGPDHVLRAFPYQNRSEYLPYRSGGTLQVKEGPRVPLSLTPATCP